MSRLAIVLILLLPHYVISQTSDQHFQVMVAKDASIYGQEVEPLRFVDDVTRIDVKPGGFIVLVHKWGATFEMNEDIFTFYLKPKKLKENASFPKINILYQDSTLIDNSKQIVVLHPLFDSAGSLKWPIETPLEIYWHLPNEPVISYKLSIMDHDGNKIQDYGTRKHQFILKPFNYGLTENSFLFQVSSTFAGETISSMRYGVDLVEAPEYQIKASDLLMKALNLELSPVSALEVWQEILTMENGDYYFDLFKRFIQRNTDVLTKSGENIEQLLSQNR